MNSNTILQSNLLDIIFENRNKDYGAYTLRRDYNSRLLKSLFAMLFTTIVLAVWLSLHPVTPILNPGATIFFSDTLVVSTAKQSDKPRAAKAKMQSTAKNNPPVLVKNILADKKISDEPVVSTHSTGDAIGIFPFETAGDNINAGTVTEPKEIEVIKTSVNKTEPRATADVMPQYPGGIKELIRYLKKNLVAPKDIDEGEEIDVKIKFVVSYDGSLAGFNIIQSGGNVFDDEVIRVIKKMPKWIPGKTQGENVSVYYVIPVKFNSAQ